MMATTHALAGGALAALVAVFAPEYASVAVPAALAGGLFPDLDLYAGHRKTLHYPVGYWLLVAVGALAVLFAPGWLTVALALFALGAALHATMDVFGSGLELRPWEGTSERAVFNHVLGRWHRPRRWVRYDGAPEDALLGVVFAVPTYLVADAPVRWVVVAAVGVSVGYALVRRWVPVLTERAVGVVPASFHQYLPGRFLGDVGDRQIN